MSTVTPNLGLFKYNTSTDANSAFNINKALNNNWDIIDNALTNVDALPDQTGKDGYILTTNGSEASWGQTAEIHCVVETYIDGASWYRVWSDGWLEQGNANFQFTSSEMTVNFLKSFSNTSYTIITEATNLISSNYGEGVSVGTKLTTGFKCHSYHSTSNANVIGDWYACGYMEG